MITVQAVEDINNLMSLSKKVFQPKMMANYYLKLALVFWKSGNFLFHAAAVINISPIFFFFIFHNGEFSQKL